ncbi:MAG: phenylalanine--tRNA ligase beta subunit-related protein [Hyphomicrobiaceae bacterium]
MTENDNPPPFTPRIDPAIWTLRPDFVALSLVVTGGLNGPSPDWVKEQLAAACAGAATGPAWATDHLAAWQDAYRAFGAKPQRTPCSAEALRKRAAKDGPMGSINAVVDLYNAVSIAYAVPVGGEDMAAYAGSPALTIATGTEPFQTMKDGVPAIEHPEKGEVVWRDDKGVTCRRWNWRQGPRTRMTDATRDMWFVLERLEPMPIGALQDAGDALIASIRQLAPDAHITLRLLTA